MKSFHLQALLSIHLFRESIAFSLSSRSNTLRHSNHRQSNLVPRRLLQENEESSSEESEISPTRRNVLLGSMMSGAVLLAAVPLPSSAGEVGARITQAVTTSELGMSVRTSVVKGAQVADQLDGQWERFSDKFGLGAERGKQGSRPKPKVIPDLLPLDVVTARQLLELSDQAFLSVATTGSTIRPAVLQAQLEKVANLVKISFERSGVVINVENPLQFENAQQFNFAVYTHFKAYSDLIVEQKIPFGPFRRKFEQQLGEQLATSLLRPEGYTTTKPSSSGNNRKEESLQAALKAVDDLCTILRNKGLVALVERSPVDDEQVSDWLDGFGDLEFTVALDGDSTLNAQILLQEQGFRLYPNFARYAITYLMQQVASDQKVSSMDYYFDTDYSSDPDKFEVKEVLLTVQLENP
jgi:hypothetical protein